MENCQEFVETATATTKTRGAAKSDSRRATTEQFQRALATIENHVRRAHENHVRRAPGGSSQGERKRVERKNVFSRRPNSKDIKNAFRATVSYNFGGGEVEKNEGDFTLVLPTLKLGGFRD